MISINSPHEPTRVLNSRSSKKKPIVWRRRQGSRSGITFTTYERPSLGENKQILLGNGETDVFNLGRLILSVADAFRHDSHAAKYSSLWLAQSIEDTLSLDSAPLTPRSIAAATHSTLKRFDELAAMQYAAKHHLIATVRRRGRPSVA
jgi:transcriptional regulator NrdR family protein